MPAFSVSSCLLFVEDAPSVRRDAFGRDLYLAAGGVVVEFDDGLAFLVRGHVRVPIKGAAEVFHGWHEAVVVHFESRRHVIALEVGAAQSFDVAEEGVVRMDEHRHGHLGVFVFETDELSPS